jgi:hypothetical protein
MVDAKQPFPLPGKTVADHQVSQPLRAELLRSLLGIDGLLDTMRLKEQSQLQAGDAGADDANLRHGEASCVHE